MRAGDLSRPFSASGVTPTVLQVQQTRLTDVLHPAAGLTHLRLLEAHPHAGTPAEDGEGTSTYLKKDTLAAFLCCIPINQHYVLSSPCILCHTFP